MATTASPVKAAARRPGEIALLRTWNLPRVSVLPAGALVMLRAEAVARDAEARVGHRRQPRDRGHDDPGLLRVVRPARAGDTELGGAGGADQLAEQGGVGRGSRLAAWHA